MADNHIYTLYGVAIPHPSFFNSDKITQELGVPSLRVEKRKQDESDKDELEAFEGDGLSSLMKEASRSRRQPPPRTTASSKRFTKPQIPEQKAISPAVSSDAPIASSTNSQSHDAHMAPHKSNRKADPADSESD